MNADSEPLRDCKYCDSVTYDPRAICGTCRMLRNKFALAALPHMLGIGGGNQEVAECSYRIADVMLEMGKQ